MQGIESDNLQERMRAAISLSWKVLAQKVGSGLIAVNKEASMQLQYAHVLQQFLPLIRYREEENFSVELETGVTVSGTPREIDLLFSCEYDGNCKYEIAVEMKCYKTIAASGKPRGATDIFMKDVYFDLHLLERYVSEGKANQGVALVMTDMERLVNPKSKLAKCWSYDTSHGATFGPRAFNTPIGGREVNFYLQQSYELLWSQIGSFWFLETEGFAPASGLDA